MTVQDWIDYAHHGIQDEAKGSAEALFQIVAVKLAQALEEEIAEARGELGNELGNSLVTSCFSWQTLAHLSREINQAASGWQTLFYNQLRDAAEEMQSRGSSE